MKRRMRLLLIGLVVLCAMAGPGVIFAADAAAATAPAAPAVTNWMQLLIPIIVPVLIMGLKFAFQSMPGWLLPILAPALGGLADAAIAYSTGGPANPVLGAVFGSAGVGVRELVDQIKKAGSGQQAAGS